MGYLQNAKPGIGAVGEYQAAGRPWVQQYRSWWLGTTLRSLLVSQVFFSWTLYFKFNRINTIGGHGLTEINMKPCFYRYQIVSSGEIMEEVRRWTLSAVMTRFGRYNNNSGRP